MRRLSLRSDGLESYRSPRHDERCRSSRRSGGTRVGSVTITTSEHFPESAERRKRYQAIVAELLARSRFAVDEIQSALADERPAFVTRVINELVESGWIIREGEPESESHNLTWNTGRGEFPADEWLGEKLSGTQLKSEPEHLRPRERLMEFGPASLSLAELLAILIRSGRPGESAIAGGEKLAKKYESRLNDLAHASRAELKELSKSVDKMAWCQIMAGIELGRRVEAHSSRVGRTRITTPRSAREFCQRLFHRLASDGVQEEFHIVTLNTKNEMIGTHCITKGTLDSSLVHPREVFRPAIRDAAAAVLLVHNHPSGDPTPSNEDFAVTRRLDSAGELLGIKVLDHIVLGDNIAASIRELM